VKRWTIAAVVLLSAAVPAAAQDFAGEEAWRLPWILPGAPPDLEPAEGAPEPAAEPAEEAEKMAFFLGARVGYLKGRDAERGTWLGGIQGRLQLIPHLAVEGSIEFHRDDYMDGDVIVTYYPVQLTALFYPLPKLALKPYLLGGGGWYFTRVDYEDELGWYDSETDHAFGFHVGAGAELNAGDKIVLNVDFRYVFIDEPGVDNSDLDEEEWDYWQITGGVNIRF